LREALYGMESRVDTHAQAAVCIAREAPLT